MVAFTEQRVTIDALYRLAATLDSLDIGPAATSISVERDRLARTIRSFLIPRALDPELPTMVVVAGPTGSGKSTVVNSLSGTDASPTGSLRPTTRKPVVLASPDRIADYEVIGGVRCDTVAHGAPMLDTMILVDAPDIDSTSTRHRAMTEALLDSADVVVFVTSALRYADEVPWQILRRAQSRGAPVIHVLNRVASATAGSAVDFRSRLSAAGMDGDFVTISEHHLPDGAGRVPSVAMEALGERLMEATADRRLSAGEIFRRVLSTTLAQVIELIDRVVGIRDEIDVFETSMADRLRSRVPDLDLAGVAIDLLPTLARMSRRAIRRWKKAAALSEPDIDALESMLIDRIVNAVTADVRAWLVEERPLLRDQAVETMPMLGGVATTARSAAEGWIDYVARIATDSHASGKWLRRAVLIDAVTTGETTRAVKAIFAENGPTLVEGARRELMGRLEVVYEHAATLLADLLRDRHGQPDESALRASVREVTATLAPINA